MSGTTPYTSSDGLTPLAGVPGSLHAPGFGIDTGPPGSVQAQLFAEPYTFDFFQAVLLLERVLPECRPVGFEGAPRNEVVRFGVTQSTAFPASSIHDIHLPSKPFEPPTMLVNFMGLTGPSGVLPRHYTELLVRLSRQAKGSEKDALAAWFDLFNHRLISLFFRAWEKYRFNIPYSRGEYNDRDPDAFTTALLSTAGLGMSPLRNRLVVSTWEAGSESTGIGTTAKQVAKIDDLSLIYFSGLLSQRPRTAINLQALLAGYFRLPTSVVQFQGQWLTLEDLNQSKLQRHANNQLGMNAVVGERVWDLQSKVRIRLGTLTYQQFVELLPDRAGVPERKTFFLLSHLTRLYLGAELDFDVQLVLQGDQVPEVQLDSSKPVGPRLGWNTWLRSEPFQHDADDAVFEGDDARWLNEMPADVEHTGVPIGDLLNF